MGLADDLVQVFQAHLILDKDDEVVIFLFQHLAVAAKAGIDTADRSDLLFLQILQHDAENAPQRTGILTGAVSLVGGQLQVLVDGALLVVVEAGVHRLRHGQGVDIRWLELDAAPLGRNTEEADIEGVGVVGHEDPPGRKVEEGLQRFGLTGGIGDHLVGDAGQLGDLGGDGLAGFDESVKFLHDFAVFHDDAADLGQILHVGVKAGGLGVKDAELAAQRGILHTVDAGDHIVHEVGFAAVDELEIRVALADVIRRQHGFGVALADTVVGDGNGRVAHPVRQPDDPAGVAEGVHAGQLGMQMQLHPLDRGMVFPLLALDEEDIVGVDDVIMLVFVVGAVAPDDDGGALGDGLPLGAVLSFLRPDLQVDGAGVIGDGNGIDLAVVALDLGEENIAPDHALAALAAEVLQRRQVLGGEHLAVEDGHGLVGQIESLHLDGRGRVLLLELDHRRRDLPLQFLFHLALFGLAHRALQGHLGFDAGVGRNPLGQQPLELHLLQKLGAVADADGDVLAGDLDGAAIQKAVDGHAVPLHLLHQFPQGGFVQRRVAEQVLDAQFKALIIGLERSQQPRTQPLVQRGGTAQGKDDLPLLPQHLGVLDNDAPKTGRKVRVRHELRP